MAEKVIKDNVNAMNVIGSSCDRNNWKKFYETHSGRQFSTCSVYGCSTNAQVGGHLYLQGEPRCFVFIAPICQSCNKINDGYKKMKSNVAYVKIEANACFRD